MTLATNPLDSPLDASRRLVEPGLRDAVARLDPQTRDVVSYHLGWLDRNGAPTNANPGKALRPTLSLLAAEAVCGRPGPGLPGAVAVELVHNFSLVHDDLIDRDAERRHRPTVWALWGESSAVLAGDAMLSLAHEVLASSSSPHAPRAGQILAAATRELIRGQARDIAFERRRDVTLAECLDMAAGKTGALLSASTTIGGVLGDGDDGAVAALADYGTHLGLAFQLVDDLLGIWGTPEVTGKPVFSDLAAGKKTLPVTWAVEHGGPAGRELATWLAGSAAESTPQAAGSTPDQERLRYAADLVERAGGRGWTQEEANRQVALAEQTLSGAALDEGVRRQLVELARFVAERQA